MRAKVKAWVVFEGGTKFGEGRAELLRLVDRTGSLKRAVEELGMSYRAAWGYLRELERAAGFAFLEPAGPGPRSGTRLTPAARAFLRAFDAFVRSAASHASTSFRSSFAWFRARRAPASSRPRAAARGRKRAPPRAAPARRVPRR